MLLVILVIVLFIEAVITPPRWIIVDDLHGATTEQTTKPPWMGCSEFKDLTKGCWERKLGQYSLFLDFHYHSTTHGICSRLSLCLIETTREGQKAGKKIELPEEVIVRVLSRFKSAVKPVLMGLHPAKILLWHIGTTICGNEAPQEPLTGDRLVANSLSD